jgi:hypothetical protein
MKINKRIKIGGKEIEDNKINLKKLDTIQLHNNRKIKTKLNSVQELAVFNKCSISSTTVIHMYLIPTKSHQVSQNLLR